MGILEKITLCTLSKMFEKFEPLLKPNIYKAHYIQYCSLIHVNLDQIPQVHKECISRFWQSKLGEPEWRQNATFVNIQLIWKWSMENKQNLEQIQKLHDSFFKLWSDHNK
jgi:hypothetical protein